ncbi:MAG: helix-turn-helix transcriptional regulator [Proteobacteria bacterium]|nr:helix-turn-helix transcriptional regulator [Pseudomonadota bacterium]
MASNYFAHQLKQLRLEHQYSMQELADLAKVSKSMISKIERGAVQPTLDIATRLAQAFGRTLSSMLETQTYLPIIKIPANEQPLWEDPVNHAKRKVLSPSFQNSKLEWLEVVTPAGVKLELSPLKQGSEKYVLVLEGSISIQIADQEMVLGPGDSGYFLAHFDHSFSNKKNETARYFLIINHN